MNNSNLLLIAIVSCCCGCATPIKVLDYYEADSDALAKIRHMKVVDEDAMSSSDYTDLGIVDGIYCNKARWDPAASADIARRRALDQLTLRAATVGADHITTPQCVLDKGMDLSNNCWATLVCSSHALVRSSL